MPVDSGSRPALKHLALLSASVVASLLLGEAGLRIAGYRPFRSLKGHMGPWDRVPGSHTRVEPGGALNGPDPVLGYTYLPGRYRITFDTGDSWVTTHGEDTLRITRPAGDALGARPGLWIFGCSYVHGWGLNDEETLPWKLQALLSQYDVANFGVGGYGDLQSLLQFRRFLARRRAPALVVLAYAGFHDDRNVRSRLWRKWSHEYEYPGPMPMPYARLEGDALRFFFADQPYPGLAAIRASVLAERLDEAYAQIDVSLHHGHRVSELLVETFAREAAGHGARFVLAGISREAGTESMLRYARRRGILGVDISVVRSCRDRIEGQAGTRGGEVQEFVMRPIGSARTPYTDTREIPKGSGAGHRAEGTLEIRPELEAGLLDIEGFSHLFVLWVFHRSSGHDLTGAPPTDDRPHGVFATRSPRRPNPIGLTVVELLARQGANLHVRGVDMLDGTPILDIKPYLSSVPAEAIRRGWLAEAEARRQG